MLSLYHNEKNKNNKIVKKYERIKFNKNNRRFNHS